jgi:hypothetical protein
MPMYWRVLLRAPAALRSLSKLPDANPSPTPFARHVTAILNSYVSPINCGAACYKFCSDSAGMRVTRLWPRAWRTAAWSVTMVFSHRFVAEGRLLHTFRSRIIQSERRDGIWRYGTE